MSLETWLHNGWLDIHQVSSAEIAELLANVDRDIAASQIPQLPTDWRFNIAYSAILHLAQKALGSFGVLSAAVVDLPGWAMAAIRLSATSFGNGVRILSEEPTMPSLFARFKPRERQL